jgi:hypothetical protein
MVSSKRREGITQTHGAVTQKTCFLNNHTVKTSKHCLPTVIISLYQ